MVTRVGQPLVRGLALLNDLTVVRGLHGEAMVREWVERLTREQRAHYEAGFLPGRWYDEGIQAQLCVVLREQLDDDGIARVGAAIVRYHANRAQRFLARVAGPKRLLARSAGLWSYWRDTGRLALEHLDGGSARVAILEHEMMAQTPGYALMYCAAAAYAVWLSGARDVRLRVEVERPQRIVASVFWAPHPSDRSLLSIDQAAASLPEQLAPRR